MIYLDDSCLMAHRLLLLVDCWTLLIADHQHDHREVLIHVFGLGTHDQIAWKRIVTFWYFQTIDRWRLWSLYFIVAFNGNRVLWMSWWSQSQLVVVSQSVKVVSLMVSTLTNASWLPVAFVPFACQRQQSTTGLWLLVILGTLDTVLLPYFSLITG